MRKKPRTYNVYYRSDDGPILVGTGVETEEHTINLEIVLNLMQFEDEFKITLEPKS